MAYRRKPFNGMFRTWLRLSKMLDEYLWTLPETVQKTPILK